MDLGRIGFASRRAVAYLGLATASGQRQLASHPSGVRFSPPRLQVTRWHAKWHPNEYMWTWGESNSRLSNANAV